MHAWKFFLSAAASLALVACDGGQDKERERQQVQEPRELPTGQLGDAVVPTHYELDLTIVPERDSFSGQVTIDVEVNRRSPVIWMHGNGLEVSEVTYTTGDGTTIPAQYEQAHETGVAKVSLDQAPPAGAGTLEFTYSAPFNDALEGLYKVEEDGEAYAFTQFEATSARLAFPSFDEPAFKVPFDIAVTAPEGDTVITATPESASESVGDGLVRHVFETTQPLPTYLIAFAVGPLDVVEAEALPATDLRDRPIPLRGVAAKGKGDQLAYALENTQGILETLESYFGRAYPYKKLDIIAVPDFAAGAMENVGAITYREQLLLLGDGSQASPEQRRAYARVHAHELAHQWFGNLVTPKWWNDIWLNESFATWMGNKALDRWKPEAGFGNLTLRGALSVMENDAMATARQIREPIESNHDIATAFDSITYQKGGGVLEMFESWLGETVFRDGVRKFLDRHAHDVADVDDFLQALADAGNTPEVVEAFKSFLLQPGVPLVNVEIDCGGDVPVARLKQQRYLPVGSQAEPDKTWQVPVCLALGGEEGRERFCTLLDLTEVATALPLDQCPSWAMPNADGSGYYRFSLEGEGWSNLLENFDALNGRESMALMGSLSAAFRADEATTATLADAFEMFAAVEDREVATRPIEDLTTMRNRLAASAAAKEGVEAFLRNLYSDRLNSLGLEPGPEEETATRLLRTDLVTALAELGRAEELRARLNRMAGAYLTDDGRDSDALPASLVGPALAVAVEERGAAFAQELLDRALASRDATFRERALSALAAAPQEAVGEMMRAQILSEELRDNEAAMIVFTQSQTREQRGAIWEWVQANLDAFIERVPTWRQGQVTHVGQGFCSRERAQEVQAFFADKVADLEGGPRGLNQTLETIRLCAALKDAKSEEVTSFFADRS